MADNNALKNEEKTDIKDGIVAYFKGVKSEWGKITWPEKNQIIFETGIVIFVVVAFTIIVYIMDLVFKYLLDLIK